MRENLISLFWYRKHVEKWLHPFERFLIVLLSVKLTVINSRLLLHQISQPSSRWRKRAISSLAVPLIRKQKPPLTLQAPILSSADFSTASDIIYICRCRWPELICLSLKFDRLITICETLPIHDCICFFVMSNASIDDIIISIIHS